MTEPDYRAMWEEQCYAQAHERIHAETALRGMHRGRPFRIICTGDESAEPIWLVFGVEGLGLLRFDAGWPLAAVEGEVRRRIDALAPDPAHTPAALRVVAWVSEDSDRLYGKREHAYAHAAAWLTTAAWSTTRGPGRRMRYTEWREHWPDSRLDRLAAWLRHRDEKAGHR